MNMKSQYRTLFDYHWHTTRQMMDCAARLETADYLAQPGYGHGSVHDLLFHLLRTARGWRMGLEAGRQLSGLEAADYPDLASLRIGFDEEAAAWRNLLEGFADEAIASDIELVDRRGNVWTLALWRVLQHLILHGMQHHAELAQLLSSKSQSPGDIDFLFYRGQS